jgi:hypothetical protein
MALRARAKNPEHVVRALVRWEQDKIPKLERVVRRSLGRAYADQQEHCPVDKGNMKRLTRHEVVQTPHGRLAWEMGWEAVDFFAEGLDFYPPYPEFGTLRADAQPSLLPAIFAEEPLFLEEIAAVYR